MLAPAGTRARRTPESLTTRWDRITHARVCTALVSALLRLMQIKQSIGFIGGKPCHSLYFVGAQGPSPRGSIGSICAALSIVSVV